MALGAGQFGGASHAQALSGSAVIALSGRLDCGAHRLGGSARQRSLHQEWSNYPGPSGPILNYDWGMTVTMNVQQAKARLSALIAEAERGGEVLIARNGRPVVRLAPVNQQPTVELGFYPIAWSEQAIADAVLPLDTEDSVLWGEGRM